MRSLATILITRVIPIVLAALVMCAAPIELSAQETSNEPSSALSNDLTIYAGAVFYNNPVFDTVVLVEFPFTLERDDFEFFRPAESDPNLYARVFAQLNLYGVDGRPVDSTNTYFSVTVGDMTQANLPGVKLFNNLSLLIKPGVYSARLTVIDVKSKEEGVFTYERIIVEPPVTDRLAIGGKVLAYDIDFVGSDGVGTGKDRLIRNGFRVIPNPLGVFARADSLMCLYAEMYNLDYTEGDSSLYRIGYAFLSESGDMVKDLGFRLKHKPGSTLVITDCFELADLEIGTYKLRVLAADLKSKQADTAYLMVRVLSPDVLAGQFDEDSAPDPYDTLSLGQKQNLAYYLLDPVQRKTLESLTDVGKNRFLEQFWRDNDPDPRTPANESRDEIFQRFVYVNAMYSTNMDHDDGWKTDRGRIYMTYGRWDERDDVEAPRTGQPFEVWRYHRVREGAVFVFEDQQGFRDYTLVHSNVEGERYSAEWENRLQNELYRIN